MVFKQSRCTSNIGRIILFQMTGALESRIQDDVLLSAAPNNDQYRQQELSVTVYEDTTYRLHVQVECDRQSDRCGLNQNLKVWIDFNGNDYDDGESRVLQRVRSNTNRLDNINDYELYIPAINVRNIQAGSHRMRLTVTPNEEYERDCGAIQYPQTREYTINVVPKARYSGKSLLAVKSHIFSLHHHQINTSVSSTAIRTTSSQILYPLVK